MNPLQGHQQLNYQSSNLAGQQQDNHNLVFGSVNYQSQQSSQPSNLYNLNFNHLDQDVKQCSGILFEADTNPVHMNTTVSNTDNKLESLDHLNNSTDNDESLKLNKHSNKSNGFAPKRQKKMKFSNDSESQKTDDTMHFTNSTYMYPNTQNNGNYYHKQSIVGSSSITSSNSSSTSSSPLSSSSPSHLQSHHQLNQNCNSMSLSSQLSLPVMQNMSNQQKLVISPHFSYTDLNQTNLYSYNQPDMQLASSHSDTYSNNQTDEILDNSQKTTDSQGYDILDNSMEDFQRTKLKKSKRDPIVEYDTELADSIEFELGLKKQNGPRKNSWGNLSYAELITRAIESSSEQRLTLSQIYDWIVKYVPYFKEKFDRTSSAGWKNSIRHNLSLHNRFIRVQNESSGKSSWWMINPDMSKYSLNTSLSSVSMMNTNMTSLLNTTSTTNTGQLMDQNGHVNLPGNHPTDDLLEPPQSTSLIKTEQSAIALKTDTQDTLSAHNSTENPENETKNSIEKISSSNCDFSSKQGQEIPSDLPMGFNPHSEDPFQSDHQNKSDRIKSCAKSKSISRSKSQSHLSKAKSRLAKSQTDTSKVDKRSESKSYSPSSPGSTSSLKENDQLNHNNHPSVSNTASKISQNMIYYNLDKEKCNPFYNTNSVNTTTDMQQNLLMDSPSSLSSLNSSNIPYTSSSETGNSILRAALQKSTMNGSGSPASSPSTPTPTLAAAGAGLSASQGGGIAGSGLQMPFTDLNSQSEYNSNKQGYGCLGEYQSNQGIVFNQNESFNGNLYSNYPNSYHGNGANKQQYFNQNFFMLNQSNQANFSSNADVYFSQTDSLKLPATSTATSLLTTTPSTSSPSSTSSSSNSSSINMTNNYTSSQSQTAQIYSNYYSHASAQPPTVTQNLGSSQIQQNTMFKNFQPQYTYPSSSYYDLNQTSLEPGKSTTSPLTSNPSYDELGSFQQLSNNTSNSEVNSNHSLNNIISTSMKSIGCFYN